MRSSATINLNFAMNLNEVINDLRTVVSAMQRPRIKDVRWIKAVQSQVRIVEHRIGEMRETFDEMQRSFGGRWDTIASELRAYSNELARSANKRELRCLYKRLSENYEELLVHIRSYKLAGVESITRAHHLKPINYFRSLFHMSIGVFGVLVYEYLLSYGQTIAILLALGAIFGFLEVTRRMSGKWNNILVDRVFGLIARPFERHKVNSSTYYLLGLLVITTLCPKPAAQVAVLILAFADPAATIVGKLWGEKKLVSDKSFAGTGAFFIVALLTSLIFLTFGPPAFSFLPALALSILLALAGAITELFSLKLDDNFCIPVVCGLLAALFL